MPDSDWTLVVVDEFNNSTVWDQEYITDAEAFKVCLEEIEKDGGDKKESILAEYLNAIDELENGSGGFVPPFLTALTKGGTKRSRKPRRKCKKAKKHRITRRK